MTLLKLFLLAAGAFLLMNASTAHAATASALTFYTDVNSVSLEAGENITVNLTTQNASAERLCTTYYTETSHSPVQGTFSGENEKEVCVDGYQNQTISLTVHADASTQIGTYSLTLHQRNADGTEVTQAIPVRVLVRSSNAAEISATESRYEFCLGEYTYYAEADVINTTSTPKTITLTADSEMFAATVIPSQLRLDAFET
ncbi:MAG: hypothetical protein HY917_04945, partial [Candidatus Diapherotrites archaeon]|nr:hypothetical protein [Candidatus Diapherotrites archaeon]